MATETTETYSEATETVGEQVLRRLTNIENLLDEAMPVIRDWKELIDAAKSSPMLKAFLPVADGENEEDLADE